ncbi:MAG: glycosyltransferase [Gammaproteobacteria bacterium]|nr:glycosyltransferase [Gammaproteobacteria bacterium]
MEGYDNSSPLVFRRLRASIVDLEYYSKTYPQLSSFEQPLDKHYFENGWRENCSPSPLFLPEFYQASIKKKLQVPVLLHYFFIGESLGFSAHPLFDPKYYLSQLDSNEEKPKSALLHYLEHGEGAGVSPHPMFDPGYYREQAGPVPHPLQHYLSEGVQLELNPHRLFNTRYYTERYPDVVDSDTNPLVHFVMCGADEGRSPRPDISSEMMLSLPVLAGDTRWQALLRIYSPRSSSLRDVLHWQFGDSADWALADPRLQVVHETCLEVSQEPIALLIEEVSRLATALPRATEIDVSIVVPVHNELLHTMGCLRSIMLAGSKYHFEIIVADDGSSDNTDHALGELPDCIRLVRNSSPLGFLRNCNAAANLARGQWIVLLNNDTIVLPGWLDALIDILIAKPKAGLVGAKLIYPDGILQESGGVVWRSADAMNIGRGKDSCSPEFNFLKEVDYCSGAAIALKTSLWHELNGFDERFSPAYYEDTDLAFRVRQAGYKVFVQPLAAIVHFEGVSHGKSLDSGVKQYQTKNRDTFALRWQNVLATYPQPSSLNINTSIFSRQKSILVVDSSVPRPDQDSGSNDTFQYLRALLDFGYHVIFIPQDGLYLGRYTQALQGMGVECWYKPYVESLHHAVQLLKERFDAVLVFRFNVAQELLSALREFAPHVKVILETVDLHYLRESRFAELTGNPSDYDRAAKVKADELSVIDSVDAVIVLSDHELELLRDERPRANVHCIPILRELPLSQNTLLSERNSLLFVGGFKHTPNIDGITWFIDEVWPLLVQRGFGGKLVIVGADMSDSIRHLSVPNIEVLGFVEDLAPIYARSRATIAPLRYGAGLKGKIISSLAYGVPCISTTIGVEGSGLVHGHDVLVADNATQMVDAVLKIFASDCLWSEMSHNSLAYFKERFSTDAVFPMIQRLLNSMNI